LYKKVLLALRRLNRGTACVAGGGENRAILQRRSLPAGRGGAFGGDRNPGGRLAFSISEQIEVYKNVLGEGGERLTAMGFLPTARLGIGGAGREIAGVAEEIEANLVVIGHRPDGCSASVGTYLVKNLRCSDLRSEAPPCQWPNERMAGASRFRRGNCLAALYTPQQIDGRSVDNVVASSRGRSPAPRDQGSVAAI
jgi:hypothetical protein